MIVQNLQTGQTHVLEMFRAQANKMLAAIDSDLEQLCKLVVLTPRSLEIKNLNLLMNYERFMPEKAKEHSSKYEVLPRKYSPAQGSKVGKKLPRHFK